MTRCVGERFGEGGREGARGSEGGESLLGTSKQTGSDNGDYGLTGEGITRKKGGLAFSGRRKFAEKSVKLSELAEKAHILAGGSVLVSGERAGEKDRTTCVKCSLGGEWRGANVMGGRRMSKDEGLEQECPRNEQF